MLPGKVRGIGGAMDLVANPSQTRVVVTMEHVDKKGNPKILPGKLDPSRRYMHADTDSLRMLIPPNRPALRVEDHHRSCCLRRQSYRGPYADGGCGGSLGGGGSC